MSPSSEKEYTPCTDWLSVKQAAAQLGGVSDALVYKLYHRGELEGAKIGGTIRIRTASVAAYLQEHSNERPALESCLTPSLAPEQQKRRRKGSHDDFISYHRREMDRIAKKFGQPC